LLFATQESRGKAESLKSHGFPVTRIWFAEAEGPRRSGAVFRMTALGGFRTFLASPDLAP
jgi:hypothetical protein